jgi:hypothetical protein
MQDPLWRELYNEVQNKHKDFSPLQSETEDLLSMWNIIPETKIPRVIGNLRNGL